MILSLLGVRVTVRYAQILREEQGLQRSTEVAK
jgi:hypothetical protein